MSHQEYMQRIKEDFRVFLWLVWKYLNLPEPTPVQLDIAHYLQHGKAKRRIIQAFRGVGKSWITSAYVVWRLLRNPDYKVMVVSASKERADAFTIFTKKLINEIPECQHLKPRTDQRDSMIAFEVNGAKPDHSPSVKSVGITGQLTGSRADEIVADDVEVPNNSATQAQRDKLGELVKEFDAILKPGGLVTYLGTPQNEMSLYNELQNRGYDTRIWPARYPKDQAQRDNYGIRLAPMIANAFDDNPVELAWTTTEPRRFDDRDLTERELSYGKAGFMLQFMLDTSLSDADKFPLKLSDLCVMNLNPTMGHVKIAWGIEPRLVIDHLQAVGLKGDRYYRPAWHSEEMKEYTGTVMAIDPSGRGKDLTAYAIVKFLNGYLYLVNAGGFSGGYSNETLTELAKRAKVFGVNHVVIEANFGDGMFTELIKPHFQKIGHPVKVEEVKHSQQKEARIIDTIEPVMMQHRLIVDESVVKRDLEMSTDIKMSLFYQMTRITREKGSLAHDDKIDALAIAVAYWVEKMAQDADRGLREHKSQLIDDALDRFMEHAIGSTKSKAGWLSSYGL